MSERGKRSTSLRSASESLAPIDDVASRELGDSVGESLFTLVKISPCQTFVSNDPTEEENVERTPCNITSFACYDVAQDTSTSGGGGATSSGPSRVSVDFDYELWLTDSANLDETVVQLESSMLQHLAKVFNLLDCPYVSTSGNTATSRAVGGGRGRHLQIFGDELADLFVGVDSTPMDKPDESNSKFVCCLIIHLELYVFSVDSQSQPLLSLLLQPHVLCPSWLPTRYLLLVNQ